MHIHKHLRDTSSQLERVPLRAARPPRPHQLRPLLGLHEHHVLRAQNPRRIRWHDRHAVEVALHDVDVALHAVQQRLDVALHDPHARLLECLPRIRPAALPEQPQRHLFPSCRHLLFDGFVTHCQTCLRQMYLRRPAGNDASGSVALQ